jgi:hypothetical protein
MEFVCLSVCLKEQLDVFRFCLEFSVDIIMPEIHVP